MVHLKVNGQLQSFDGDPEMPLLWYLRDILGMTGTKFGCGMALCGACTVLENGKAIRSCRTPMSKVEGVEITTIEGIGGPDNLHPMQDAFVEHDGFNAVTAHRDRSCPLSPWSKSSGGRQTQKCERR